MKTEKLFALVFALALAAGCQSQSGRSLGNAAFTPTDFATNITPARVVSVVTNQIVIVTATNEVTGALSHVTNREAVTVQVNWPAQTNLVPVAWKPNESTVAVIKTVGGLLPGYGDAISGAVVALLGIVAALRGKKYRAAAQSLARGVNNTIEKLPEWEPQIIAAQKHHQDMDGTRETVRALLKTLGA